MKELIKDKIEELLSKEYACSRAELNGKQTVYSVHPEEGQRILKLLAYRNCVVICTSKDLHKKVRELLQGKSRDEMFEIPLYNVRFFGLVKRLLASLETGAAADSPISFCGNSRLPDCPTGQSPQKSTRRKRLNCCNRGGCSAGTSRRSAGNTTRPARDGTQTPPR